MSAVAAGRGAELADPRPVVVADGADHLLAGGRCVNGHPLLRRFARCPHCRADVSDARYGPGGVVWAVTVVHVPSSADDEVPYTLAYVDLDDGPRILLRIVDSGDVRVGDRAVLGASTATGNPTATVTA